MPPATGQPYAASGGGRARTDAVARATAPLARATAPLARATGLLVAVAALLAACGSTSPGRPSHVTITSPTSSSTATAPTGALAFGSPVVVAPGIDLTAVSCLSPSDCVALSPNGQSWAFDGHGWRGPLAVPGLDGGAGGRASISCAATACVADPDGGDQLATWDGTGWSTAVTVPGATALEAVGCSPTGYCAAVDALGDAFALVSGSWTRTAGDWGSAVAVSCPTAGFCLSAEAGGLSQWSGHRWSKPDPEGTTGSLTGVSCATAASCAAIDDTGQVLRWNGATWSSPVAVEPPPTVTGTVGPALTAVSCPATTSCVAVDDAGRALQWHGSTWTAADVDGHRHLTAVACPTASFCVAVDSTGHALVARS